MSETTMLDQILSQRSYDSPNGGRSCLFPSLVYHSGAAFTIWKASLTAAAGRYSRDRCGRDCRDVCRAIERAGGTVSVRGLDNIAGPDPIVVVRADRSVPYSIVDRVIEFCRGRKLRSVVLRLETRESQ